VIVNLFWLIELIMLVVDGVVLAKDLGIIK